MKKGKLLIIDDNEDILFALNLLLEPYMEQIRVATQPERIDHFMRTFIPDLKLTVESCIMQAKQCLGNYKMAGAFRMLQQIRENLEKAVQ